MFSKDHLRLILLLVLGLSGASFVAAQTAPVSGRVELKKADGTTVPVEGALVEVFRVDIKSKLPSDKTNKKGEFAFAGLPLGARFALSVSAPGASPGFHPSVKAGDERILITLSEGDGKRLTEAEVRQALAGATTTTATGTKDAQPTEVQKKAEAERLKAVAEYEARKKDVENKNAVIERTLKEGNEAYNAKNYDLAIAKWSEGIAADPNFVGSAPILLNNRAVALRTVGTDLYNRAVKSADPAERADLMAKAKKNLEDSLASYTSSWTVLKAAAPADIPNQPNYEKTKLETLAGLTEAYRLLVVTKTNPAKAAESKEAFDAYLAAETDTAKKAKAQLVFADLMRESGDSEKAIAAYRQVLQTTPDSAEAMAGLGLSLFNAGVIASDKAQMQEGLNFMTKYIETSPIVASDSAYVKELKTSVKEAVEYLKTAEKLAPQKVTVTKRRN